MPTDFFLLEEHREPYHSIVVHYCAAGIDRLTPRDSETRLFLTDIPIIERPQDAVGDRTVHLTRDGRILVRGVTTEAQALLHRDIARFALFVHFFGEILALKRVGTLPAAAGTLARELLAALPPLPAAPRLMHGPFADESAAQRAVGEAGAALVAAGLVDSIFGNISYRMRDTLLISRSGAPLDKLDGGTALCPLCEECGTARCASSEYPSHRRIALESRYRAVLHGHPRWTVIRSLAGEEKSLFGLPVVTGDPGADLARTLPDAVTKHGAAIVRGHGLFAAGEFDFNAPFAVIHRTETAALAAYRKELS
ncbi:MAG TPA: class II aldolase/adducin family protein [bacterium]|nr:class II aldolase/adducin family protein [bacterium]